MHHYGTNHGYAAGMSWVPERGFGVVLLVNRDADLALTYAIEEERWAILDRFLELEGDPPDSSTDPSTWTAYIGTYVDPAIPGRSLIVEQGEDGVVARFEPSSSTPMALTQGSLDAPYQGGDVFQYDDGTYWYINAFYAGTSGTFDYAVVYTNASLAGQYYFVGARQD